MTILFRRFVCNKIFILNQISTRNLTTSEASTILRPFYFAVHPDLFGQYPKERNVNETSLKQLNSYLDSLQGETYPEPLTLTFYLRHNTAKESLHTAAINHLHPVTFTVKSHNVRSTVKHILKSCMISTDRLESIPVKRRGGSFPRPIRWDPTYYTYTGKTAPSSDRIYQQAKPKPQTLRYWMQTNISKARQKLEDNKPLEREIKEVREFLCKQYGIRNISWHSGWGLSAYRACLNSLCRLTEQHAAELNVLRGRSVVFSSNTGIDRNGSIVLSNMDVPHHWLMLLGSVDKYEAVLDELPVLERALSTQLGDIQIIRRENIRILLAEAYHNLLSRMLRSVVNYYRMKNHMYISEYSGSYYGDVSEGPDRPKQGALRDCEILVENDAGDVRLLSTGQFLVPATYPPVLLLEYILDKQDETKYRKQEYLRYSKLMEDIMRHCQNDLELDSLTKDNAVTPEEMMMCCQRLLDHPYEAGISLQGLKLKISKFYSVSEDGEMCIPWDWKM
ncbi:T-cell activation inhibitor, mitochondrial-like [Saccoglossus kowalevskii]|uniref:T-cell activation inhibitor, mitochondrial-like n=1 Tax=Saccoglossus kowalevskii TaxID=10224 RepID=A0ABM0GQJ5_SACKO|nr:PREDICTED: T-cell activation inhibitor, mitochondrial-like [Saccoglossus kowalevskii]